MSPDDRSSLPALVPHGNGFHIVHLVFDLAALSVAWRITAESRLLLNPYMATNISRSHIHDVAPSLIALLGLWLAASAWLRTYRDREDRSPVAALFQVSESSVVFCTLAIVVTFFMRSLGEDLSRSFVLLLAPVTFLCLVGSLAASVWVSCRIQQRWPAMKRVAVLGSADEAESVIDALRQAADRDMIFCGLILPERCSERVLVAAASYSGADEAEATVPLLGTTRELPQLINRECLDRIIIASEALSDTEVEFCGRVTRRMGVTVTRPVHRAAADVMVRHSVQYGMHLIDVEAVPFSHFREILKRGMDISMSLVLITLLLPLLALLALLVRITSDGPIFYKSPRVGMGGRYFTFWKFRSMYLNGPSRRELLARNENSGHLFKIRKDPRITPIGRLMRRFSLDELPQLFNVLVGDMSLVGPRPLPVEDLDADGMSREFAEWAEQRSVVRPGITGLWQVSGRSELPFERMIELDMEYVRNRSLALDLSILAQTFRAVVSGQGAY
jgi:exopolysaccharide biosynthesis polyprenyl glycosylphosphotransferase